MEPLPAGLILLGLTTPAVIAYRHPKEFNRLGRAFLVLCSIALLALGVWQIGYGFGRDEAVAFLAPPLASKDALEKHSTNLGLYSACVMAAAAYVWLLMGLPLVGLVQKGSDK